MKFSDLAAQLKGADRAESTSAQAVSEIQQQYLFDISGAEFGGSGGTSGGSNTPPKFNAWGAWSMAF